MHSSNRYRSVIGVMVALLLWPQAGVAAERTKAAEAAKAPVSAERDLKNIKQLTFGRQNAEAYFSFSGNKLIFQSTNNWMKDTYAATLKPDDTPLGCYQMYVMDLESDQVRLVSTGSGVASDRRIGLGITGLADALVMMKIRYDSQAGLDEVEKMMRVIRDESYRTSIALAKEKGAFPLYQWDGYAKSKFVQALPQEIQDEVRKHGIRNSTVLTVPPVGTGSIVAQTSSGIEPIFCTSYRRRVKNHDGDTYSEYKVYHPLVKQLFGDDEKLPEHVVTAHQIDPYFRVKMQGVIQKYVDSSISSAVNLAEDVSVETVADIYMTAYRAGLKGHHGVPRGEPRGHLSDGGVVARFASPTTF